ncbi:putative CDP-diacylglycerol--glycerol-3-phosphate 3-phosphatidyltransferase (Phosphatidylglycerophosphate synthase) (PGP synthase) [Magnetospira sp. QH-2]|nr:putative CDP-diacylglycerol--glycerol-3-phosphate 3-phosphatidyltransferase (Phosphatidylglycerophosphate synthase) (PGP synthase) [Magnetospira sp. QH-2]
MSGLGLIPNLISLARMLAVPVMVWLVLDGHYETAFWLFAIAGLSDALDGFLARLLQAQTEIGIYLDPLADKALLVGLYVTLGIQGGLPLWLVILVVFRDLLIIAGALLAAFMEFRLAMHPLLVSKANTLLQILLGGVVLWFADDGAEAFAQGLIQGLTILVALFTLLSGGAYVIRWVKRATAWEGEE